MTDPGTGSGQGRRKKLCCICKTGKDSKSTKFEPPVHCTYLFRFTLSLLPFFKTYPKLKTNPSPNLRFLNVKWTHISQEKDAVACVLS